MWLCEGKEISSNSDIQQPDHPLPSVIRGANLLATRVDRCSGNITARAVAWIKSGAMSRKTTRG